MGDPSEGLIQALQSGRPQAFRVLFERHGGSMLRVAQLSLKSVKVILMRMVNVQLEMLL